MQFSSSDTVGVLGTDPIQFSGFLAIEGDPPGAYDLLFAREDCLSSSIVIGALAASVIAAGEPARAIEDDSDSGIKSAVSSELALDEELARSSLGVAVTEGVVTLTGKLPSLLLKERASDVAELVRGVRAVVNRIEIEAPPFSDAIVRNEVSRALAAEYDSPSSKEIGVTVEDGTVVLTGAIPSLRDRLRIEEVVRAVSGVRRLDDRLQVERLPVPSDVELQRAVRRLLGWDSRLDDSGVEVIVEEGAVRLRGHVRSAAEKSRAIDLAGIPGVVSVDASGLRVELRSEAEWLRPGRRVEVSDEEIERAVEDALFYDPRVRSFRLTVEVEDGIATLQGEVRSLAAELAAEKDTASVVGVLGIENELSVRPQPTRPDSAVAGDVELALRRDPYLEVAEEIVVSVTGGTVHLYGSVDTELQRERAADLASTAAGAVEVENHVEVAPPESFARKSNPEIRKAVMDQLRRSALVDFESVDVRVEDGMATLTGEVESLDARRAASREAFQGGAVLVKNQLEVLDRRVKADPGSTAHRLR